ncbi:MULTISPECIES: putative holin-like toxin [Streptococcus]
MKCLSFLGALLFSCRFFNDLCILMKGGAEFLTAFEVVQTLLGFGSFTITLIGLCYKIFKDDDKKK